MSNCKLSFFTSWDWTKMNTILINRSLFIQMCQIPNRIFCRWYFLQSAHVNSYKHQVAFAFEVFCRNKQILPENTDGYRQRGLEFTLCSGLKIEAKKTSNSDVSIEVSQISTRNFWLLKGQKNSPSPSWLHIFHRQRPKQTMNSQVNKSFIKPFLIFPHIRRNC